VIDHREATRRRFKSYRSHKPEEKTVDNERCGSCRYWFVYVYLISGGALGFCDLSETKSSSRGVILGSSGKCAIGKFERKEVTEEK